MDIPINILAIESSCDDTSAAVIQDGKVLSNIVATQKVHENYGGVVPELASRAHIQNIIPVVEEALNKAGIEKSDLTAIACTQSPGLIGSLIVGLNFSKAMAQSLRIPLIAINHMQAHILAHWAEDPKPRFPILCLTVSGGHTQIVKCNNFFDMEIIGTTLDDAAGEAFDKIAKMLGLNYPGGHLIDKLAQEGNPDAFEFSEPEITGFDFSFSGVKTSVLYFLQKKIKENQNFVTENLNDMCASIQKTIINILIKKLKKAAKTFQIHQIGIAGGVSANSLLRKELKDLGAKNNWEVYIPAFEFCTDNAAMIGVAGYYKYLINDFATLDIAPSAKTEW